MPVMADFMLVQARCSEPPIEPPCAGSPPRLRILASSSAAPSAQRSAAEANCALRLGLSLPKSGFERIDDVARQGLDAQQRLRTARSGVCRACPSRAKHAFASRYNRWHISHGFGEGAPRTPD